MCAVFVSCMLPGVLGASIVDACGSRCGAGVDCLFCAFFVLSPKEGGSGQGESASGVAGCAHWVTPNRNGQPPCGLPAGTFF